jgi:methionine-rich copper-binding protein CopC
MRNGEARQMSRVRAARTVIGLAVVLAAMVGMPAPAWAHTELQSTAPADGATVEAPIDEVTLTFSGAIRADGSSVEVTGADGKSYGGGPLGVLDFVVHQPVAALRSGDYRVEWRVLAGDGHAMTGEFMFAVALPPELEPTTPTMPPSTAADTPPGTPQTVVTDQATGGGGSSWVWWPIGAVAVSCIIVLAVLAIRRARRQD